MSDSQVYLAQRENDARFSSDTYPNREECFLCHRMIQQSEDFNRWFIEDGSGWVPTHYSDFTDAFETVFGWVCGTDCWNDHALDLDDDPGAQPAKLFLVRRSA